MEKERLGNQSAAGQVRCCSSVVEHPLGKGEVVSSILTSSTNPKICPSREKIGATLLRPCAAAHAGRRPADLLAAQHLGRCLMDAIALHDVRSPSATSF